MRGPASCSRYLEDQLTLVGSILGCSDSADGDEDASFNLIATVTDLPPSEFLGEAIFAAGNFWELEATFCRVDGFVKTATGYYGGTLVKPCYKEVLEGNTDHTEAVKLMYDKRKTSYKSLCKLFWASHDPTNKDYLLFLASLGILRPNKHTLTILDNISGFVKPRRMTLLL